MGHTSTFAYGYADGQLTSSTDPNSQTTTYKYNIQPSGCSFQDEFDRLGETDYPDGGKTAFCYNDSPYNPSTPSPSVTTTEAITSSLNKVSTAAFDGVGHAVETILSSDPDGTTYTVTSYDGLGKPYQIYNPTRCSTPTTNCGTETTWGYTTNTYDALGRTTQVAEPDGSITSTVYSDALESQTGYFTTVTDEIGNQRTSKTDGLGRLTYVWEAPNNSNYNYQTAYAYDPLNNLLSVNQTGGSRTRTFTYDSLSRLLCAANPEVQLVACPTSGTTSPAGAITYTYDLNNNLSSKVAPEPDQTTGTATETTNYSYDALNRLTQKAYVGLSNNPTVKFGYDGGTALTCGQNPPTITSPTNLVGRRSAMCAGKSGSAWSYDPMGRPLLDSRINAGSSQVKLNVNYSYYKDGSLNQLTYPSGDVVTYTVGSAGRATYLSDANTNYVGYSNTPAKYAPNGSLASMTNGHGTFAGIVTSNIFNDRFQPILLLPCSPKTAHH